MTRSSKVRVTLAFGAIVLFSAPVALASGGLPKLPDASGHLSNSQFQVKPSSILISGDGSFYFDGRKESHNHAAPLKWTGWTATGGLGSGFNWVNNCRPNCAAGTFHLYPVKLHAWQPKKVGGRLIFTRMTVTYTSGWPSTVPSKTDVFKVGYTSGGVYLWKYPSH